MTDDQVMTGLTGLLYAGVAKVLLGYLNDEARVARRNHIAYPWNPRKRAVIALCWPMVVVWMALEPLMQLADGLEEGGE